MSDVPAYPRDAAEREAAQQPARGRGYASWGRRFVAYLVDLLVILVPLVVLIVAIVLADPSDDSAAWVVVVVAYVATIVVPFLYFTYFHGESRGQTPGKRLLGIRVVSDESGRSIGFGRAFGRYAITAVFGFFFIPVILDYLWPLWDSKNQTLHDKVVGSVVVRA
jgi:uncharacterized RDD family membrane protein YckC